MGQYKYIDKNGTFTLENPECYSYLYFPLANEEGIMSSVTPDLSGDLKKNQNTFVLSPVSSENLHNDKSSRNILCKINGKDLWSLTGKTAEQQAKLFSEEKEKTSLTATFMSHTLTRESKKWGLNSKIQSFVPYNSGNIECMIVTIENQGSEELNLQPVVAIPLYARSADNIRDHRHVTALLHRIETTTQGVVIDPTLTFDERGHQKNTITYGVFAGSKSEKPEGFIPVAEDYIGEGGSFEQPRSLYESPIKTVKAGTKVAGFEACGTIVLEERTMKPGEVVEFVVVLGLEETRAKLEQEADQYLDVQYAKQSLKETEEYWQEKVNVRYGTKDENFNQWMRWVSFQPMLRRIFGCSFLPHHDYGKGGRGWRDLWQDCLALLMMNPDGVRQMLVDNFGGVRLDGSNATIIGAKQGEFIADRNHITRVWMDHGVWPLLTTALYINQTGDLNLLLEENTYFKDLQIHRGDEKDMKWEPSQGQLQKTASDAIYKGTILEHLLVQNLTSFYDVGEHNEIRMRGADWNDALDLAKERGESVAFTTMYAQNLETIADFLVDLANKGQKEVTIAKELSILLNEDAKMYDSVEQKQKVLSEYCDALSHTMSGETLTMDCEALSQNLKAKAAWMKQQIRKQEWIETEDNKGWYNGYYDNHGQKVEGFHENGVRMMLTSQVFSIMSGTATDEQVKEMIQSVDQYLYKKEVGGYRLNTDLKEIKTDLGRMFGFAYGQKENGAVFCHMAIMYANALYSRGQAKAGYKVIETLYEHCDNFELSKIYPGVPEYVDGRGRGLYHYLTGAASWLLVTVVTKIFGVEGKLGNLEFAPQLLAKQFDDEKKATMSLPFGGKNFTVTYENVNNKDPEEYSVAAVYLDGEKLDKNYLAKETIETLSDEDHDIKVELV